MNGEPILKSATAAAPAEANRSAAAEAPARSYAAAPTERKYDRLFHYAWLTVNGLLVLSILFALYAAGWEFSTRRYLKGFSDAIVPATAPADEKVEAILRWMQNGPARLPYGPSALVPDRDPTDTLNYDALLQVCGTATNAFINLAETGHLPVRRLLLLDQNQATKHVVAEVLVDGRWILVDPAYRTVFRDPAGKTVTREEMQDPATFAAVAGPIPKFLPIYTFENTVHIRVGKMHLLGMPLRSILNRVLPGWEDSTTVTLLVERESFAALVVGILLVFFFALLRYSLRWFGEARLGIHAAKLRAKIYRAGVAFLDPTN
ncbi:MAG TPA: hypothetical protein VGD60_16495 [Candidatus Acidoferrales bacterium]